jgi:hypothetical protein
MSGAFLAFATSVCALVAVGIVRFFPTGLRVRALATLFAWFAFAALLGVSGILANPTLRPPGIVYVFLPTFALVVTLVRSRLGALIAASVPVALLIGLQSMRVVVEIFLDRLWHAGLLPTMMTFHGANFDILIGLSAPLVAAAYATGKLDPRWAFAWNVAGLGMLANVVVRNVLASPALHVITTNVPNTAIGTFPYSLLPAFIVPLALTTHVVALRALAMSLRARQPARLRFADLQRDGQPLQARRSRRHPASESTR